MRYIYFLILFTLFACQPKEEKPEIDYVNMEMFPLFGPAPSSIAIDFNSKTITFRNILQWAIVPEDLNDPYYKANPKVDFEYIKLNEEEFIKIKNWLNLNFIDFIKKENDEIIKNPNKYSEGRYESNLFKFDVVENNKILISTEYLHINQYEINTTKKILQLIYEKTSSENNKIYLSILYSDIK